MTSEFTSAGRRLTEVSCGGLLVVGPSILLRLEAERGAADGGKADQPADDDGRPHPRLIPRRSVPSKTEKFDQK